MKSRERSERSRGSSNKNFRGSSRGTDRGSDRGFNRRSDRRSSERTQMHSVVCDKCGKNCEVPFKPTSSKPIYCNDCFKKPGSSNNRGSSNSSQVDEKLEEINEKLDLILEAMEVN